MDLNFFVNIFILTQYIYMGIVLIIFNARLVLMFKMPKDGPSVKFVFIWLTDG